MYRRRRQSQLNEDDDASEKEENEEEQQQQFRLVRGFDGNLYRIKVGDGKRMQKEQNDEERRENTVHDEKIENTPPLNRKSTSKSMGDENIAGISKVLPKKKSKKKITFIVEDASDSETENDEYKSIWRNRHPSPGKWMEPVESFGEH